MTTSLTQITPAKAWLRYGATRWMSWRLRIFFEDAMTLNVKAKLFRRKIGSPALDNTAIKVTKTLAAGNIPCTVVGGMALQEHGYFRGTLDVDLIVPSIDEANSYLSIRGFKPTGAKSILYDRENGVEVNLLEAGAPATNSSPLPIPDVGHAPKATVTVISLRDLIEMKLNVYAGNTVKYAKHFADVMELISRNNIPRDGYHSSEPKIQAAWDLAWGAVHDES